MQTDTKLAYVTFKPQNDLQNILKIFLKVFETVKKNLRVYINDLSTENLPTNKKKV